MIGEGKKKTKQNKKSQRKWKTAKIATNSWSSVAAITSSIHNPRQRHSSRKKCQKKKKSELISYISVLREMLEPRWIKREGFVSQNISTVIVWIGHFLSGVFL